MKKFLVLFLALTSVAIDETPYSLDIMEITYSDDAGRQILYDFTDGEVFEPNRIRMPESAIIARATNEEFTEFLWEVPFWNPGGIDLITSQGLCRIYIPHWHYPNEDDEIYNFVSLGAHGANQTAPMNWDFTGRVSNTQNQNGLEHPEFRNYQWSIGGGSSDIDVECFATAVWFTGWYNGLYYNHALMLSAEVYDEINDQRWESWQTNPILVENIDPATTEVELKIRINNGTYFSAFYRLNDAVNWQPIWEDFIAPSAIPGFPSMSPHLTIENGLSRHYISKFDNEELARLASWWNASNCDQETNYSCWGMDINHDGFVDMEDFMIFAENWLTQL